jgi:hypothetical protein
MVSRQFVRHPAAIPIAFSLSGNNSKKTLQSPLKNVSQGGLCFLSPQAVPLNCVIHLYIPVSEPPFEVDGRTVWCQRLADGFDVGVQFEDASSEYAVRMVEQVCHIRQYQKDVLSKEGRVLSDEEAAMEWIEKYAADFPR